MRVSWKDQPQGHATSADLAALPLNGRGGASRQQTMARGCWLASCQLYTRADDGKRKLQRGALCLHCCKLAWVCSWLLANRGQRFVHTCLGNSIQQLQQAPCDVTGCTHQLSSGSLWFSGNGRSRAGLLPGCGVMVTCSHASDHLGTSLVDPCSTPSTILAHQTVCFR